MPYRAPVTDMQFLMDEVAGFRAVAETDRFADATSDTVTAILTEAAKLAETELAPLQRNGDTHPATLENGVVRSPSGFAEAYAQIAEGGWPNLDREAFTAALIEAALADSGMGLVDDREDPMSPDDDDYHSSLASYAEALIIQEKAYL